MDPAHVAERKTEDGASHAVTEYHAHPGPAEYVKVAVILAVATAVEIALYYIAGIPEPVVTFLLIFLMVIKFALVALWFMHLKFDSRIFTRLFAAGLLLALGVFFVVLLTLGLLVG